MAERVPRFPQNELVRRLQSLFRSLTETDYDSLFYKAVDGETVNFEQVFPTEPTLLLSNHSYITGKKRGQSVDAFPRVVRFYPYVVEGHEKDIGNTTHVCVFDNSIQSDIPPPEQCVLLFISNDYTTVDQKRTLLLERYGQKVMNRFVIFHNPDVLRLVRINLHCVPTASLLVALLLGVYSKSIYIYGYPHTQADDTHYLDEVEMPDNIYFERESQLFMFLLNRHFLHALEIFRVPPKPKPKPKPKAKPKPKPKPKPKEPAPQPEPKPASKPEPVETESKPEPEPTDEKKKEETTEEVAPPEETSSEPAPTEKKVEPKKAKPKKAKPKKAPVKKKFLALPAPNRRYLLYRIPTRKAVRRPTPRWLQDLRRRPNKRR